MIRRLVVLCLPALLGACSSLPSLPKMPSFGGTPSPWPPACWQPAPPAPWPWPSPEQPKPPPPVAAKPVPTETVVLLPNEDGRKSAVIITARDGKSVQLDEPYAAAQVAGGAVVKGATNANTVNERYAKLLAVKPPTVRSFTLYFEFDRAVLTAESQADLERILVEGALAPAAELDVIGHTDTKGTPEYNARLGQARAAFVAGLLAGRGFARERISVQNRGERELLVETPDDTDEPKNRRVEIRLR